MNLHEIAQKIVDATMEVIDNRNINIMDCDGFIIASGEQSRVNTYHKGADDVIKSDKCIEIYPEQVKDYPGAKEGVNMPINVLGKRIGVVGVYGHPDEVRIVAKLVKRSVELTFEQHLISEQVKLVKDLKQQIIRKLIYGQPEKNEEEILCLCKIIGIDIKKKRCAIILELIESTVEDSLKLLKAMNNIESFLIDHRYIDEQDFSAIINRYYIIFKEIPAIGNEQQILNRISQDIYQNCGYQVKIAMGSFHQGISGYQKSYWEAKDLLKIGDKPIKNIADLDMQVEYLLR
ncbi:MAG: sugar diacid recognition domain-containing protein, partial [Clostridia bacterium]|nr:sugar diacid recognition domain-containing protein [Clostridia bacterium]